MAESLVGRRFGPVTVVPGDDSSSFSHCTGALVDGGDELTVIDPGAGKDALLAATERLADARTRDAACGSRVTHVINTHYHFDHIRENYLFAGAVVMLNPVEKDCFPNLTEVGARLGVRQVYGDRGVDEWIRAVSGETGETARDQAPFTPAFRREWWLSTRAAAAAYPYGEFTVGRVRMVMIHTPGHTAGLACPYFPDEGLVLTGDIDLTPFGPWYCGSDGDIDGFIRSARALLDLDAEWYLTGHQEGLLRRDEFAERLDGYLGVIDERDQRLLRPLSEGVPEPELPRHGLLYHPRYHVDPWIRMWDTIAVGKHLDRLRARGLI